MATQVETVANGIKVNGKIKSKNQLRRLKAKQKKAEEKVKVCPMQSIISGLRFIMVYEGGEWQ